MDDADAAEALSLAAALDPYGDRWEITDTLVDAWTLAMPDVDADLAKRAVIAHYRQTTKRIGIADVIAGADRLAASDRAAQRHQEIELRKAADRAALPAAGPTRDRTADIAALLAKHRNWDPVGHLPTRRKQASWHPDLERAYRRAVRRQAAQEVGDAPDPE
jgi:hypothetical protein